MAISKAYRLRLPMLEEERNLPFLELWLGKHLLLHQEQHLQMPKQLLLQIFHFSVGLLLVQMQWRQSWCWKWCCSWCWGLMLVLELMGLLLLLVLVLCVVSRLSLQGPSLLTFVGVGISPTSLIRWAELDLFRGRAWFFWFTFLSFRKYMRNGEFALHSWRKFKHFWVIFLLLEIFSVHPKVAWGRAQYRHRDASSGHGRVPQPHVYVVRDLKTTTEACHVPNHFNDLGEYFPLICYDHSINLNEPCMTRP